MEAGIGSDGTRLYVHVVCSKEVGGWRGIESDVA
jgi:hypothetical protein